MDEGHVYPVMAWVTELSPQLLFGSLPHSLDDVGYLVTQRHVTHFINLCDKSSNNDHVRGGFRKDEAYRMYFDTIMTRHGDETRPLFHRASLEVGSFHATGRLKPERVKNTALFYLKHAKSIVAYITTQRNGSAAKTYYLHQNHGAVEHEVFTAIAVFLLWKDPQNFDPLVWIKDYERIFDRDPDKLEILAEIWREGKSQLKGKSMFMTKKQKGAE